VLHRNFNKSSIKISLISEETDMTLEKAKKIVGNQPRWAIKNMVKALSMHSQLNTAKENERLAAAKIVLQRARKLT
tara:strand:+ start:291 stop:518 length:228 start_codon:yes stop_codon:yes gene_type:complete